MRIDRLSVAESIASLRSAPQGLSVAEARTGCVSLVPTRWRRLPAIPLWLRFFKEFFHFFAVILWVAAGLAFLGEWSAPGQGMAKVGCAIVGVILVSGLFSFWQEYRVEQTLAALRKLLPQEVEGIARRQSDVAGRGASWCPAISSLLEQGDNIPADCRLIEAFGVRVNNATHHRRIPAQGAGRGPLRRR